MFKYNLKIAWRHLLKDKYISAINLTGLIVGMTAVLFIWQYVAFETSYDDFHENSDRIVRVRTDRMDNGVPFMQFAAGAACAGSVIADNFAEVEDYVKLYGSSGALYTNEKNITFRPENVYYAMPSLFEIFSFSLIEGNEKTALAAPFKACISETTARKMFGDDNPIGKTITRNGDDVYQVTGIFPDSKRNSHLKYDILLSYVTFSEVFNDDNSTETEAYWDGFYTYLLLRPDTDVAVFESKIPEAINRVYDAETAEEVVFALQPLKDIHLNSNYLFETERGGDGNSVHFLFYIGIFVLLIAWFNYINLSTARSEMRAKEVGIRKVAGSNKRSLVFQFLTEAALLNLLAIVCAFGLAQLLSPWFVQLVDKPIPMSIFTNSSLLLAILATFLVGTVLAGLYPAFLLSSFKPISVLKTGFTSSQISGGNWMRKGLVVFQFMASIGLIASTLIVYNQLQFMQSTKLGVNINQTLVIKSPLMKDSTFNATSLTFKKELEKIAAIQEVSASTTVPGQAFGWTAGIQLEGAPEGENVGLHAIAVDHNFAESYGIEFVAGRPMDENNSNDVNTCILNEKGVEQFGFDSPEKALGARINFWGDIVTVIGVTKNFHQESPKSVIEPMIMRVLVQSNRTNYYSLKMGTNDLQSSIAGIEKIWNSFFPNNPFDYFSLDDHFNQQYASDRLFGKIFTLFSGLAIFVSCLGLFALIAFVAERKRKEIGIRKVLGATVPGIVGLLSKEFVKLVLIALAIATPVAWFAMNNWLENFENRIDIPWSIFVIAGVLAVVIAFVTVSFHSVKAALANPVKSLRNE